MCDGPFPHPKLYLGLLRLAPFGSRRQANAHMTGGDRTHMTGRDVARNVSTSFYGTRGAHAGTRRVPTLPRIHLYKFYAIKDTVYLCGNLTDLSLP